MARVLDLRRSLILGFLAAVACATSQAGAYQAEQVAYDWPAAMKAVAQKFKGTPGVYLHLGDSISYANPYSQYARNGQGHSAEEKAFLKWSHCNDRNDTDGWFLTSNDVQNGRSHTAASGVRADEYLQGGKHGLPSLADIVKKYNPQMALVMLGTNDLSAGRPVAAYIADMEKLVDALLANGTVPLLSTLPPHLKKMEACDQYNAALKALAEKKKLPLVDLNAEMRARAGEAYTKGYMADDGVHLSPASSNGPASEENLKQCGYLLRGYLAVQKGMEVKAKVLD
ncbi:MAG: SGNH/GDSL hydrolase family protein [Planctomycetota bacterium]|nr:SGNH/GDSL hydrolase family protein [Planctomycetota bacterium]